MRKPFFAAIATIALFQGSTALAQTELVINSFGGAYEKKHRELVIEPFEKANNVKVTVVTVYSADMVAQLRAQKAAPRFDVVHLSGVHEATVSRLARKLGFDVESETMQKLEWLGIFRKKKIGVDSGTPAFILQHLLEDKWQLKPKDKDMIIMQHEFEYELEGKQRLLKSTMVMKGADSEDTAMARLVGLPMGIFTKLLLEGRIRTTGVNIPVMREVYDPVLEELKRFDVEFMEHEV